MSIVEDRVRVIRLIEYEGPRSLVEEQVAQSIHGWRWGRTNWARGPRTTANSVRITAVTLGTYPEVMEPAREVKVDEPDWSEGPGLAHVVGSVIGGGGGEVQG